MKILSFRMQAGFTLVELLCVLAIAGILSMLAYPSFRHVVHHIQRSDAVAALQKIQTAQERYRADHTAYGSLADIGMASTTAAGHYILTMPVADQTGFEVLASAQGAQASDADCRHMKLAVHGLDLIYASGPDTRVANDGAANRRCWAI